MTTTSNTSTQTNQTNQFQVSLKHGDYVLLTSNIFKNDKEVDSFIEILKILFDCMISETPIRRFRCGGSVRWPSLRLI